MPETLDGTYYADAATAMSLAGITAAQAASIDDRFNGGGPAWIPWATVPTGITVGNGTLTQQYRYIGGIVVVEGKFTLGSTSIITGAVTLTHPFTAVSPGTGVGFPLGLCTIWDNPSTIYPGVVIGLSSTTARLQVTPAGGTYATLGNLSGTVPITWATTDVLQWRYEFTPV